MIQRVHIIVVVLAIFSLFRATAADSPKQDPPFNILFFLSDDHRADFLGCAGHPILKTPNIDKLAALGTRFENAYVTTSICAASRASIFSGLYERAHQFTFGTPPLSKEIMLSSYPAILKSHGYYTGFIGKFGVTITNEVNTSVLFDYFKPLNRSPYIKTLPDGSKRHVTDIVGDKAAEYFDSLPKNQNFCLSISFNAAHAEDNDKLNHFPWTESENGLYENITIPEPEHSSAEIYDAHPQFLKESLNRVRYYWRWDTPEKYQSNVKAYYRMITGLDRVVGGTIDELKKVI